MAEHLFTSFGRVFSLFGANPSSSSSPHVRIAAKNGNPAENFFGVGQIA
jgi:hypothetical protein